MLISVLAWLAAAPPMVAVVGQDAGAVAAACPSRWQCVTGAPVDTAVADAASLGLTCTARDDDDGACWRRFLTAEHFAAAVLVRPGDDGDVVVLVVEPASLAEGRGDSAVAAFRTALAPPAPAPAPPPAPVVAPPTASAPTPSLVPIAAVVAAGSVALATGVAAGLVSADLDHSINEAVAGRAALEDYDARNGLFFALAGVSTVAAAVAVGAGVVAWVEP